MNRGDIADFWRRSEGAYVRDLRIARGMTQGELAEAVGIDNKQNISAIETGRNHVPAEKVHVFAEALRVPLRDFGLTLLRYQNPWLYAACIAADPQLKAEIRSAEPHLNIRRGPKVLPLDC